MKKATTLLLIFFISGWGLAQNSLDIKKITASNLDVKAVNDPLLDYKKYKTYSVVSANVLFKNKELSLEEKHLEFFLKNAEDIISIKNIPLNDSIKPDLMFVYDFSNDYKEKLIPPKTYSFPIWKNGASTSISSNSISTINAFGDVNLSGNIIGNRNTTVSQTGNWEIQKIERPAYSLGQFFTNFSLIIYDTSNNTKIWEGDANGTSTQRDFRLPAQYLIWNLLFKVPKGSYSDTNFLKDNNGQFGFNFYVFNTDGTSFYPGVYSSNESIGFQEPTGIKEYDIIISINGISTENKTVKQIHELLMGNVGTKAQFVIIRDGKVIKKTLVKKKRK